MNRNFSGIDFVGYRSYLADRYQRVKLNDSLSDLCKMTSGVPKGSIIGPYLFIFYVSDLIVNLDCQYVKYADDTTLILKMKAEDSHFESTLSEVFEKVKSQSANADLVLNVSKSKLLVLQKSKAKEQIHIPGVQTVNSLKLLGITLSNSLKWDEHFRDILKRCNQRLYVLRILKPICDERQLTTTYTCLIRSVCLMRLHFSCHSRSNCCLRSMHSLGAVIGSFIPDTEHVILYNPLRLFNLVPQYDSFV